MSTKEQKNIYVENIRVEIDINAKNDYLSNKKRLLLK